MELTLSTFFGKSFTYTSAIAYNLALCIWAVALWAPEKQEEFARTAPSEDHLTLISRAKEDLEPVRLGLRGAAGR